MQMRFKWAIYETGRTSSFESIQVDFKVDFKVDLLDEFNRNEWNEIKTLCSAFLPIHIEGSP